MSPATSSAAARSWTVERCPWICTVIPSWACPIRSLTIFARTPLSNESVASHLDGQGLMPWRSRTLQCSGTG